MYVIEVFFKLYILNIRNKERVLSTTISNNSYDYECFQVSVAPLFPLPVLRVLSEMTIVRRTEAAPNSQRVDRTHLCRLPLHVETKSISISICLYYTTATKTRFDNVKVYINLLAALFWL